MNATFLQNHCVRRHGQTFHEIKSTHTEEKENAAPIQVIEQLKEIKERLVLTESQLTEERKSLKEINMKVSKWLYMRSIKDCRSCTMEVSFRRLR